MYRAYLKNLIDSELKALNGKYGSREFGNIETEWEPNPRFLDIKIFGKITAVYDAQMCRLTTVDVPLGEKFASIMLSTITSVLDTVSMDGSSLTGEEKRDLYMKMAGLKDDGWEEFKGLESTCQEDIRDTRVFFDMDGVLARWNSEATMEEVFSKGYFRNLKPDILAIELAEELQKRGYDVHILSKATYQAVAEKYDWIDEHMPFISMDKIVFVPLEGDKEAFVPGFNRGDILIDDYNPNLYAFHGKAVKYLNGINSRNRDFPNIHGTFPSCMNVGIIDDVTDGRDRTELESEQER